MKEILGRVVALREHGNLVFADLSNFYEKTQISFAKRDHENFAELCGMCKLGNIIKVAGEFYETRQGTRTLRVHKFELIKKTQRPLPKEHFGLKNPELARRLRCVDYIINPRQREILKTRHKIIEFTRDYMKKNNIQEVETPVLGPVASGAAARPFATHYDAQNRPLYLRIAPELELKKLIIAGFPAVYEIAKCFRNEGIDGTHLPEFTMAECYITNLDYESGRNWIRKFFQECFATVFGSLQNEYLDFSEIPEISYTDFLVKKCGLPENICELSMDELVNLAKERRVNIENCRSTWAVIDKLYKKLGINRVKNPILIFDYPNKPLAKANLDKPGFYKAFQVVIDGKECANCYVEEDDPDIIAGEFEKQMELAKNTGEEDIIRQDPSFIEYLRYGMPRTVGFGFGIDRLVAVFMRDAKEELSVRDVITFPLLKPENKQPQEKLKG
jgi:lysyl-tRNA synthetase class 2